MDSINKLLTWANENWSQIVILIGLIVALYEKINKYLKTSKEEKIKLAKEQIQQVILKLVADAEEDYQEYQQAGSIKRSQVLNIIYEKYPVLAKVVSQEELIVWIDQQIDDALEILRDILSENEDPEAINEEAFVNNNEELISVKVPDSEEE